MQIAPRLRRTRAAKCALPQCLLERSDCEVDENGKGDGHPICCRPFGKAASRARRARRGTKRARPRMKKPPDAAAPGGGRRAMPLLAGEDLIDVDGQRGEDL